MINVHSCHAGCREPLCVLRREKDLRAERDALQSEVARLTKELHHETVDNAVGNSRAWSRHTEALSEARAENARLREALKDVEMAPRVLHFESLVEKMQAIAAKALQQSPVPSLSEEKKVKSKPLIAPDVCIWQDMAGDTALEKMLNAYLTSQFIGKRKLPVDECLSEARKVMRIVWAYGECADSGAAWDELGRAEFPEQSPETSQLEDKS